LIGIIPREDDKIEIDPIVPSTWKYFIAENILYHGHDVTILYDGDGTRYKVGTGFKVYINGKVTASQPTIGKIIVDVPPAKILKQTGKKHENYAVNVNERGYPIPSASFVGSSSSTYQAVDGRIYYDYIPSNRWSNFDSKHNEDWFAVDFGREKTVNTVSVYVYDDVITKEGRTSCPTKMNVQYHDGVNWKDAGQQFHSPAICASNDINKISFSPVKTKQIRVVFTRDVAKDYYVGITELEVWAEWPQTPSPNIYEAEDGLINDAKLEISSSASGQSYVGEIDKSSSSVQYSGVQVENAGDFKIRVYYANADKESKQIIEINNLHSITITYPTSKNGWGHFDENTFVETTVPLLEGNNILIFHHSVGFAELDKIQIMV